MTHMYFWARTDGIRTFRHALRAAYRTAISAAQILVYSTTAESDSERILIIGRYLLNLWGRTVDPF